MDYTQWEGSGVYLMVSCIQCSGFTSVVLVYLGLECNGQRARSYHLATNTDFAYYCIRIYKLIYLIENK